MFFGKAPKHRRAPIRTLPPGAYVSEGPVLADGIVERIITLEDGSGRIQTWRNGKWEAGGDLADFWVDNKRLTAEELRRRGIPVELPDLR